ncbi:MAG: SRPBCC family protein [Halobacteriaceae archaeon]
METVTVTRDIAAPPGTIRDLIADTEAFMRAGGFDTVVVEDDHIELENGVGLATITLTLTIDTDAEAALRYHQTAGIFEEMETVYTVEPAAEGTRVTARTNFALDLEFIGGILDATVIKRQRRRELESQFDWLASRAATDG